MDEKSHLELINITKRATCSGRLSQLKVYFDMKQTAEFSSQQLNIRGIYITKLNISDGTFCENS